MHPLDLPTFALRLGLALLMGAFMGLERQWHERMAGTRTNALVAVAAAAFAMTGMSLSGDGSASRVVGQIISGVGFLCAGVIFKEGANVHGLNTAATVWCAAAVGALSGIGYPQYSLMVALAAVLTNLVFRPLTYRLHSNFKGQETNYSLELACGSTNEQRVRALLLNAVDRNHVQLISLESVDLEPGDRVRITALVKLPERNDTSIEQLVAAVSFETSVNTVSWHVETPVVE